jgi:hypothetical protein
MTVKPRRIAAFLVAVLITIGAFVAYTVAFPVAVFLDWLEGNY